MNYISSYALYFFLVMFKEEYERESKFGCTHNMLYFMLKVLYAGFGPSVVVVSKCCPY
jgi:hypothetical protein